MRFVYLFFIVSCVGASLVFAQDVEDGYSIHVVQRGENLFRIALSYNLTTEELASINGITNPANIQVGQRLLVPSSGNEGTDPSSSVDDVIIEEEAPVEPSAAQGDNLSGVVVHTVQSGETLFRIATQYGSSVNDVASANSLGDATQIFPGQQLIIPNLEPPDFLTNLPTGVVSMDIAPLVFAEGKTGQIQIQTATATTVTGTFLGEPLVVLSGMEDTRHLIWMGVPMFTEAGSYPLQLTFTPQGEPATVLDTQMQVIGGAYGSETINLIEGRDTLLNENVENAELELLQSVATAFNPQRYFNTSMGLPAAAPITSSFGTRRSYNGGAFDRFHSGTDFAGAPGTPILAPAAGQVVLADELNVRGNATMIDHGWGIYTGYWHQTEIYVAPGDTVETGQVIGTIGSTGRVTGAHLHWELWVHGVPVDPMQWVQQSFLWNG